MGLNALLIIGTVAAVAGAGYSAYGSYQQGKAQSAIASFNAKQQESQAKQQMLALQIEAGLRKNQAEGNFKLRQAEVDAANNNAKALDARALAGDRIAAINLQKRREDYGRMQSTQRSEIAASGVVESSGTPLDLLAETAGKIQQDQEEQHFENEVQRRTLFSEANAERLGGQLALAGATMDRDSSLAAAALQGSSARGVMLAGKREAEITRLTGSAARTAANYQATATLLSGVSSAASYYKPKAKTTYKAG